MNGKPENRVFSPCSASPLQQYGSIMSTLELTDDELVLLRNALRSFLTDFGHDEADVITRIQQLLHKLASAQQQAPRGEDLDKAAV